MDKEVEKFTQQYLASCKEHIERLANNPELLQKTLEPFMKIQEQYLSGNNLPLESDEEDSDEGHSSDLDELKNKVKKLNREAVRLGYRIALMKPKSNEENK
ncbi:hypothetical protein [Candidatus Mesenet endosymbiont of Agriotes lineatus]|uniref:hypothetical protein n=1 Tax=Candidatus Mesenet endosymbiont of Agriotes lineatus TaxID=3077948 RepID=UPI0030CD27BC